MNILLIGEYSRLHNSLKEGLIELNHNVTIVGNKDRFKNYPVDIFIEHSFHSGWRKKLKLAIYKLTSIDIGLYEIYFQYLTKRDKFKNYDVVQLINESSLKTTPRLEIKFLKNVFKHNKKVFLLCCGVDHHYVRYWLNVNNDKHLLSPYLKDKSLFNTYRFQLQYLDKEYRKLHHFLRDRYDGVISSDMDYHLAYKGENKYLGMVPNPINVNRIKYIEPHLNGKIKIFHGINSMNSSKKGNHFFTEALNIIKEKFPEKVKVIETNDLPYDQYLDAYEDCHILLDQIYAYDQGYNALEAMAGGKVVFTGAEAEWLEYYGLNEDSVAINALPDVDYLVNKLEMLILNPNKILSISENARRFIEKEHHYIDIAKKYVELWTSTPTR